MNLFRAEDQRTVMLSEKERQAILSADPSFQAVSAAAYFDNYDLPCPVRVTLVRKNGQSASVVLRKTRRGNVEDEARIFSALSEYGLPVPKVLSVPFKNEADETVAVYSVLPGENLQKLGMHSAESLVQAKELLIDAVMTLNEATDFVSRHEMSKTLPCYTLISELEEIRDSGSPWLKEDVFRVALQPLTEAVKKVKTPLVFSNGDYQPGNFMARDGKITGFLDFEFPGFRDPLMGFTKYLIYDLQPLCRTDIIGAFLKKAGFSQKDFNLRLALSCLNTLVKEIPVSGGDGEMEQYRSRVLALLKQSLI